MTASTIIGVYVGVGVVIISGLHTWYATHVYEELRFGLPFSKQISTTRSFRVGYIGSLLMGIVAGIISFVYIEYSTFMNQFSVGVLLETQLNKITVGVAALILLSQLLAGSSWSKVILDGALYFMAFMILISYVQPPSFWNLFTVYAAIIPPLGGAWGVWREYFIRRRVAEDDGNEEPMSVLYPHFPSFSYFIGSSTFVLIGALYFLIPNVQ